MYIYIFIYKFYLGESGLLGHGDCKSYSTPKVIKAFKNLNVESIACGSLHTIVVANGSCYSWGKGEGGQLGIKIK